MEEKEGSNVALLQNIDFEIATDIVEHDPSNIELKNAADLFLPSILRFIFIATGISIHDNQSHSWFKIYGTCLQTFSVSIAFSFLLVFILYEFSIPSITYSVTGLFMSLYTCYWITRYMVFGNKMYKILSFFLRCGDFDTHRISRSFKIISSFLAIFVFVAFLPRLTMSAIPQADQSTSHYLLFLTANILNILTLFNSLPVPCVFLLFYFGRKEVLRILEKAKTDSDVIRAIQLQQNIDALMDRQVSPIFKFFVSIQLGCLLVAGFNGYSTGFGMQDSVESTAVFVITFTILMSGPFVTYLIALGGLRWWDSDIISAASDAAGRFTTASHRQEQSTVPNIAILVMEFFRKSLHFTVFGFELSVEMLFTFTISWILLVLGFLQLKILPEIG